VRDAGGLDFVVSGAMLLLLDQWSKGVAAERIRCVRNSSKRNRAGLALCWLAALASALVLYRSQVAFQTHIARIGLGAAFGGAAGNLLDLCRRRPIVDFIDLGWWPVFNIADAAITGGLILAFCPLS
jgi:lipoprotein signal peptidase